MKNGTRISAVVMAMLIVAAACQSPSSTPKVPGIPQDLSISTDADGNSTLSWSAVSGADSYNLYYSDDSGATYGAYAAVSETSFLLPFYGWYKVSAVNEAGEGTKSAGVERTEPPSTSGPAATPEFSVEAGTYDEAQSVAIDGSTTDAVIYYTIDGTTPVVGTSDIYSSPIEVAAGDTVILTAIAVAADYSNSDAAQGTFHVRGWETVGSAGFSGGEVYEVSLALDGSGYPYVGYRDASVSNRATVMKYNGTAWSALGGAGVSTAGAYYTSIDVDSAGAAYLAYYDGAAGGKVTCRKFSGSSWTTLGIAGFSDGEALFPSLAVYDNGSTHIPYVAYQDGATTPAAKATVSRFSGSSWATVGAAGFSTGTIDGTSLKIDSSGTPYLAFIDSSTGTKLATVMKYDGSSWSSVGSEGFSSGEISYISLALDSLDTPYIAYSGGTTVPGIKATVMRWSGSAWTEVGTGGFSAGTADYVSLAISGDDTLFVAFKDGSTGGNATVMKYDGSGWITVGTEALTTNTANYLDLALDPEGIPFLAFKDGSTSPAGKLTVLAYR